MLWKLQFDDEVMNIWRSYNRGVKNYMKEDYRSYIRNFWSCEKDSLKKKKKKKKGKIQARTWFDTGAALYQLSQLEAGRWIGSL